MRTTFTLLSATAMLLLVLNAKKPTDDTSNPIYAKVAVATIADPSGKPAKPAGMGSIGLPRK